VLLHGLLGSSRNVSTLARQLAESDPTLSVFALDLPGHGTSPPLPADADLGTLAREVLLTARAVGAVMPSIMVGHSLGGRVALAACLLEPAAIAHVTLLDITPSPIRGGRETTLVLEALLRAPDAGRDRDVFRVHFRQAGLNNDTTEWLLMNLVRERDVFRWRSDREALAALHHRTAEEDLWPAVEGRHPYQVHCVRGARSGYVDDDDARRLEAAACPVDTVDAGHFLHVERPAEVLALVRSRLDGTSRART
jgi:pimeloyl-ACP methyl ester carboxylesterase